MPETSVRLQEVMPMILEQLEQGRTVCFTPRGTSMLPMILGGRDQVVLAPITAPLKKYDLPLYQRKSGQYVLHRIVEAGQTYTCIGDNQFAYEPGVAREQMLAVVVGFVRKGKTWSVDSLAYRMYCRLWHCSRGLRHFWIRGVSWLRRHLKR